MRSAQELAEQRAKKLEEASQYKSDFLANMSHELRTPLNSLLILSKMLEENKDGNLTDKQVKFTTTIHNSGSELLELMNDILDLSKVEAGKLEIHLDDFELGGLQQYIKRNYEHVIKQKNLFLKIKIANNLPTFVRSDRQKIEQIIKNLISNAVKFTNEGGITVQIKKPNPNVQFRNEQLISDQTFCISISDSGIGIPKDKLEIIFAAFQQADGTISRKHGGTGLGLSISREFSRLLGGEIQVISTEGEGPTFNLYLPYSIQPKKETGEIHEIVVEKINALEPAPKTEAVKKDRDHSEIVFTGDVQSPNSMKDDRADINPGDKTVLIVEDDIRFANILIDISRNKRFKCLIAYDGESGLGLAKEFKPSAIILDIELPRMDGWQVIKSLQKEDDTSEIPVYFISVADKSKEAKELGAIGYLKKPVDLEELNQAFVNIENAMQTPVKKLLLVSSEKDESKNIHKLFTTVDASLQTAETGSEALKLLQTEHFDCLLFDLTIQDMDGLLFVKKIRKNKNIQPTPIIVYTDENLSKDSELELAHYTDSIILKTSKYVDRLIDETTLFLHRIAHGLPKEYKSVVPMTHDKQSIFNNKKILIVNDDMRNVFALSQILEEKNMQVVIGKNGLDGIAKLKENKDTDLVLMDIMMPEMNGYEAMTEIRKHKKYKNLPIIALTAKAMKSDREKCINAGANDYLPKPVEPDKLLSLLRVWLYKK